MSSDGESSTLSAFNCDPDVDVLLQCSDSTCDLGRHEAALAMCEVDAKSDLGEDLRGWMEGLQHKLFDKAQDCYDRRDAACLKSVYYALAAGAKVKGMHTASGMMWNFLECDEDPATIDAQRLLEDAAAQEVVAETRQAAWSEAESFLADGQFNSGTPIDLGTAALAGASPDIWYGMGSFKIEATGYVTIADEWIEAVDLEYEAIDRYNWHVGSTAGGGAQGVSEFRDAWGAWLVDVGEACEFDMGSSWSEVLEDPPAGVTPDPADPGGMESCVDNCGASGFNCGCDAVCLQFGDCCPDYEDACG